MATMKKVTVPTSAMAIATSTVGGTSRCGAARDRIFLPSYKRAPLVCLFGRGELRSQE
jgi:hypothetical protein